MRWLRRAIRRLLLRYRPQVVYPSPLSGLQPERLYAYLDTLFHTRDVDGAVLEIGCWLGGTAATASAMLRRIGSAKRYVCVDTFAGFVPQQFARDERSGVPSADAELFRDTSPAMVRRLLDHYGCGDVELVQGDIVALPEEALPERVSVCLIDVDLELPVHAALDKVWPRLAPGGAILVDDCPEQTSWVGSRRAYEAFVAEIGVPAEYRLGFGLVRRAPAASHGERYEPKSS